MRCREALRWLFRCLARVVPISSATRSDAFFTYTGMPSTTCGRHLHDPWKASPSGFTEVVDDQGDLLGCVQLGSGRHAAGLEGGAEVGTATDPEAQVAQCAAGGLRFREVEHGQLRLPVGTDFEFFQMSWFWVKQKVNDIDLRRLLLRGGLTLEQRADVDREEGMAGGLTGDLLPVVEGLAVGVGAGEEDDVAVAERTELLRRQHRQSTRRHPDILRIPLGHDHGGLLRFDNRDAFRGGRSEAGGVRNEMQAEEAAVDGQVTVVAIVRLHPGRGPVGVVRLVAVAVVAVEHDLAVAGTALVVYLPEDHAAVTATAEPVALRRPQHLLLGEIAAADQCPAEHRVGRQPRLPEFFFTHSECFFVFDFSDEGPPHTIVP